MEGVGAAGGALGFRTFVSEKAAEKEAQAEDEAWATIKQQAGSREPEVRDNRSLYERLKEQKTLKQEEWETARAFKNQVFNKGLDEDEAEFLESVLHKETDRDLQEQRELRQEMEHYKKDLEQLSQASAAPAPVKLAAPTIATNPMRKKKQASLIAAAVKRKGDERRPSDHDAAEEHGKDRSKKTRAASPGAHAAQVQTSKDGNGGAEGSGGACRSSPKGIGAGGGGDGAPAASPSTSTAAAAAAGVSSASASAPAAATLTMLAAYGSDSDSDS